MADDEYWFAPKRYGYGTGLPISWQGWVATLVMGVVIFVIVFTLGQHPVKAIAALIPVALVFALICARKTRGGLRWRWGEEE